MVARRMSPWILAARPKTLSASIVPVIIGIVYAYRAEYFRAPLAIAILICAVLIQVLTNFVNDVADFERGADTARVGPARAVAQGLISPESMKRASIIVGLIALLIGSYLVWEGGVFILLIGILSLLFAVLYTAGPWPIAYLGLGEIFVILFFGPLAVVGTEYLFTYEVYEEAVFSGLAVGFLSTAILVLNNLRDIETDTRAKKRTLAVRFGANFARIEYLLCILAASLMHIISVCFYNQPKSLLLVLISLLPGCYVAFFLFKRPSSEKLISYLGLTSASLLLFGILFALISVTI